MNIPGLLFLLITHFLTGRAILSMFNVKERTLPLISLSFIIGVVLFSLIPVVLEMAHIPITTTSVSVTILVVTALTFGIRAHKLDHSIFRRKPSFDIKLYEIIYLVVLIGLMIPSIWRCYYYCPNARDVLSGPEVLAEYAVKEHTIINSVFTIDLSTTNNHLKPPFVLGLQIIYKLLVHPFGQLWLTVLVLSFLSWLYFLLRERIHPLVVGFIMLFFVCMPDPYGYTYMILFDYSNMILFFAGVYYLSVFAETGQKNILFFSSFMFGLATTIRSETLVLIVMFVPAIIYIFYKKSWKPLPSIISLGIFGFIPFVFYYFWIGIFLKYYMPGGFNVGEQINLSMSNIDIFFTRISEMNSNLLFYGEPNFIYGYIHHFFLFILILDCVLIRRFTKEAVMMLYGIAVVYFALPLLGYLIPLFDLSNTTKRGMYKMFPLMALYMANSGVLTKISNAIRSFEFSAKKEDIPQPVVKAGSKPQVKKK